MLSVFADFKRAWRLTKLIRASEINDEEALAIEKIDTLYIKECVSIRTSLDKTRKSLNRALKSWQAANGKQLANLENALTKSVLEISQLLDASQKTLATRLGQVEQTSQTTMELVNNVREYVAKQADETRRWQEGYDWRILKNYLTRLISTLDDIETKLDVYRKEEKPQGFLQDFDFLRETLEIHLEEEGLLSFAPLIGADVDPIKVDIKGSVECTAENQADGTVAEIVKKGFEIELGTGVKVVRRAQVTVYKK